MSKIPVDDFGLEVIRKAAQNSDDETKYDLRTNIVGMDYQDGLAVTLHPAQLREIIGLMKMTLLELKEIKLHLSLGSDEDNLL